MTWEEALVYVPHSTAFSMSWVQERLGAAQLTPRPLRPTPSYTTGQLPSKHLMGSVSIRGSRLGPFCIKRGSRPRLLLARSPQPAENTDPWH